MEKTCNCKPTYMKPIDKTFNLRGNSSLRQVNYGRFWLDDWMIQAKLHGDFLMPKMLRTYLRIHHEHGSLVGSSRTLLPVVDETAFVKVLIDGGKCSSRNMFRLVII